MFDNLGLNPQQQAIAEKIAAAGFAAGMTEAGVAAMVTHAIHESGLNPTLSHPDAPPGSAQQFNSNGLFQMNRDRWDDLVEYAAANGLDPWSADAQIGYQIHEMTNPPQPGLSNYQKIAEPLFYSNDPRVTSNAFSKIEGHAPVINGISETQQRIADTSKLYAGAYNELAGFKTQVVGPPTSAQIAQDVPAPLQNASMGGLLGPISAAPEEIPGSSFFGQIGNAALAQTGQPFGAINMGTAAGFNRPGMNYGYVGNPVSPTLFDGMPDAMAYAPVDAPPDVPAAAPPTGARLPEMASLPVGSFGAMPLGNYQMASIAQPAPPAPQPSANVSISALAGPAPSLSLSGKAIADPLAALAGLPSAEQLRAGLPAPGSQQPIAAPAPAPSAPPAPVAARDPMSVLEQLPSAEELAKGVPAPPSGGTVTTSPVTPQDAPSTPTAGVGGFANLDTPSSAPTISTVSPTITTAAPPSAPASPGVSFGSIPAAGGIPGASLGIDMSSVATPPSQPVPLTADPRPDALMTGMGSLPATPLAGASAALAGGPNLSQSIPAPAPDLPSPTPSGASVPALGLPGASTAVDIQQGLAGLPAPVDLPSTPTAGPAAPHPGTQWGGLADAINPPSEIKAPPTVGADLLSPNLTQQEQIPTVKAPEAPPTQVAGPGVPALGGLPAPVAAPAVRSMPAPVAAPAAPPSYSVPAPAPQPQQAPSFGALGGISVPQQAPSQSAPSAYGVVPTGSWGWNTTTATPASFGGYGSFANISDWTPAGYEFGPTEQQIAATGSGPFGALSNAFGGSSFGYDYGGIY